MKALLIANGVLPDAKLLRKLAASSDLVVCADGGAAHAVRLGLQPDVIIGDLDSLPASARKRLTRAKIIESRNQNFADLEKALRYVLGKKPTSVTVVGATGARIDHTIANISLLKKYHRRTRLKFIDPTGELQIIEGKEKFRTRRSETISLLPLGKVSGVSTKGLRFPLKNEFLAVGSRGVSNEAIRRSVEIRVRRGKLLLVRLFGK
jgi:thiamine pyrophosphokinase